MLRYVHRRLKEIAERTYTILDAQKSWTCDKSTINHHQHNHCSSSSTNCGSNGSSSAELCRSSKPNSVTIFQSPAQESIHGEKQGPGSQRGEEKCHGQEKNYQHPDTWISALTWSSALICGWYASQLLCLHRRHLGWDTRCFYSKFLMQSGRAIHSKLFTRVVFASPFHFRYPTHDTQHRAYHHLARVEEVVNEDSGVFSPTKLSSDSEASNNGRYSPEIVADTDNEELFDLSKFILTVNDDKHPESILRRRRKQPRTESESSTTSSHSSTAAVTEKNVNDAAKELQEVLGQIEFELGVKAAASGDMSQSFSHFKLATAHEHAGATFNLGICFEQGIGVKQDMRLAMECYDAAARLGHPKAMYNLGVFYATGLGGLRKNRKAARRCFMAAAHLGQIEAKLALGIPVLGQDEFRSIPTSAVTAVSPVECAINYMKPVLVS